MNVLISLRFSTKKEIRVLKRIKSGEEELMCDSSKLSMD